MKRIPGLSIFFTFLVFLLQLVPNPAAAQDICVGGHPREERKQISTILPVSVQILDRLAKLAEFSTQSWYSNLQRLAFNQEYQALITVMATGSYAAVTDLLPSLSVRGGEFVRAVIDPEFLGLAGTKLVGESVDESIQLSMNALQAVNEARSRLMICVHSSWDRVPFIDTVDRRDCGGGWRYQDYLIVFDVSFLTSRILLRLTDFAEESSTEIYSSTERQIRALNFEYLLEELEILGEMARGDIHRRTAAFLKNVVDPSYMNLKEVTIAGTTASESQSNAVAALGRLREAFKNLSRCTWRRPEGFLG